MNKEVLWRSTVILKISLPHKEPNQFAASYGVTNGLVPFPLHSWVTTMTGTVNKTISQTMADTLLFLIRMVDPEEFARCV